MRRQAMQVVFHFEVLTHLAWSPSNDINAPASFKPWQRLLPSHSRTALALSVAYHTFRYLRLHPLGATSRGRYQCPQRPWERKLPPLKSKSNESVRGSTNCESLHRPVRVP